MRVAAAGIVCAPVVWVVVWLHAVTIALLTTALDVIAWPWVAARRRRGQPADAAPRTRNASVIVPSYNGLGYLEQLLPTLEVALARAPGDHEIIVVDNGSTDGSASMIADRHPDVRVVRLPENRFFIRGIRAGVEVAARDILVMVNNDMRVEPDFLRHLLEPFDRSDVFAVTGRIEMAGERVETGRARGEMRRGALHFVHTDGPDTQPIPVLWGGGGSTAYDRAKYLALGGFEDLYEPCYAEDLSLSYRAWRRGWRVLLEPRSGVEHVWRGTSEKVFTRRAVERMDRRNRELFFLRAVTDLRMLWSHALWRPWNVIKAARRTGVAVQLLAMLAMLPRLPRAWAARQVLRADARRSDRDTLRIACSVREHRRDLGLRHDPKIVLSLGHEPASIALEGFDVLEHTVGRPRDGLGKGELADRVRDLLREHDHDIVVFRDPGVLAAVPAHVTLAPAVLVDTTAAATRRPRRRVDAIVDTPEAAAAACRALAQPIP